MPKKNSCEFTLIGETTEREELKIGEKNIISKNELKNLHEKFFKNLKDI